MASCLGKTHFFPSCPPEAPSVRVGWKWEEWRAGGNASALAGRVRRPGFSWSSCRVGSGSCWEREGLARGGPVFSEASDLVPVLPTGILEVRKSGE